MPSPFEENKEDVGDMFDGAVDDDVVFASGNVRGRTSARDWLRRDSSLPYHKNAWIGEVVLSAIDVTTPHCARATDRASLQVLGQNWKRYRRVRIVDLFRGDEEIEEVFYTFSFLRLFRLKPLKKCALLFV